MMEQIDKMLMQLWIHLLKILYSADDEPAAKVRHSYAAAVKQNDSKVTSADLWSSLKLAMLRTKLQTFQLSSSFFAEYVVVVDSTSCACMQDTSCHQKRAFGST